MVVLTYPAPYAATGDEWRGGGGERSGGRAISIETVSFAGDLTGRWDGAWLSTRFSAGRSLTIFLTQSESSLTGEVGILDTACLSGGAVSGSV
jgi:hypothetical protein